LTNIIEGSKLVDHIVKVGFYPKYELITTHTCRRSFASNLYGKIETALIMRMTGHKSQKQLLEYIGMADLEFGKLTMNEMMSIPTA